jgi:hypothetical protein
VTKLEPSPRARIGAFREAAAPALLPEVLETFFRRE